MTGRKFSGWQTAGGTDDVMRMVDVLERPELPWCAVGGIAVNHWAAEPMVTRDVEFVVAVDEIDRAVAALEDTLAGRSSLAGAGSPAQQSDRGPGRHRPTGGDPSAVGGRVAGRRQGRARRHGSLIDRKRGHSAASPFCRPATGRSRPTVP